MAMSMPPFNSYLRELFDTIDLNLIAGMGKRAPQVAECKRLANNQMACNPGATSIVYICMLEDGCIDLIEFHRNGAQTILHNFGKP